MIRNINTGVIDLSLLEAKFTPSFTQVICPFPELSFIPISITEDEHEETLGFTKATL